MIRLAWEAARAWIAAPRGGCAHALDDNGAYCGSDDGVRLFPVGRRCRRHTPAAVSGRAHLDQVAPAVIACAGCGHPMHPAAAAGLDGTPRVFDRHPGCEPRPRTARTIQPWRHNPGRRAA